jgi:hypothetical protein
MRKIIALGFLMALSGCQVHHHKATERAAYKRQMEIADSARVYDKTHR